MVKVRTDQGPNRLRSKSTIAEVLIFCVPFPYGVWGRKWNSIASGLIIAFSFFMKIVVKYGHRHTFTTFIITKSCDEVLISQKKGFELANKKGPN